MPRPRLQPPVGSAGHLHLECCSYITVTFHSGYHSQALFIIFGKIIYPESRNELNISTDHTKVTLNTLPYQVRGIRSVEFIRIPSSTPHSHFLDLSCVYGRVTGNRVHTPIPYECLPIKRLQDGTLTSSLVCFVRFFRVKT